MRKDINSPLSPGVIGGHSLAAETLTLRDGLTTLSGYSATLSAHVTNTSWNERIALNAWLLGQSKEEFAREEKEGLRSHVWGPWPRQPDGLETLLRERQKYFDEISANPVYYLNKYNVRYVVAPVEAIVPLELTEVQAGVRFQLYEVNHY